MRKRIVIWGVVIAVVLMAGLLLLLPKTVKCQESITVSTPEGDTTQVTFDVELKRSLLGKDKIHGTITIEDIIYTSIWDIYGENIDITSFIFLQDTDGYALDNHENQVIFTLYDNSFEAFMLHVANKSGAEQCTYYGPAETVEEVEAIWDTYLR